MFNENYFNRTYSISGGAIQVLGEITTPNNAQIVFYTLVFCRVLKLGAGSKLILASGLSIQNESGYDMSIPGDTLSFLQIDDIHRIPDEPEVAGEPSSFGEDL